MNRESLLDEAISKAKEAEDWQLAEWLRMARGAESAARWYSDKLREAHRSEREVLNENRRLRELIRAIWEAGAFSPGACYVDTDELNERTAALGLEVRW